MMRPLNKPKDPWIPVRRCDYCVEHDLPAERPKGKDTKTGCRHYRGGKTATGT